MSVDLSTPQLPPQALDAESGVLGAILLDAATLPLVQEFCTAESFYRTAHRRIFAAMEALDSREEPIDQVTLVEELTRQGALEDAGGSAGVAELLLQTPSTANARAHAKLVAEKAVLRTMITIGTRMVTSGYEGNQPAAEVLEGVERALYRLSQGLATGDFQSLATLIPEGISYLDTLATRPAGLTGLPSGLLDLDALTGGWQESDLILIAARPSMGKTSLALGAAMHAASVTGLPVGIFSLEMSKLQLVLRMVSMHARIDSASLRTGRLHKEEWQRAAVSFDRLAALPIWIDDSGYLSVMQIRARARRMKARHGLGLLIVDYLQLLAGRAWADNRQEEIADASRQLKLLAKELEVPVIALSQLNRDCEKRQDKRPILADLRESGSLEQDADLALFIYRDEVYNPDTEQPGIAELLLRKHRNGPIGEKDVAFLKRFARFDNLATAQESLL